jgi:CheY-like chemotaxis protein
MERPLAGRIILVIEDESLIALDIQETFKDAGARTIFARTVSAALVAIQEPGLSAAIVDHVLGDGDSTAICERLKEMKVPFITYSGVCPPRRGLRQRGARIQASNSSRAGRDCAGLFASQPISN